MRACLYFLCVGSIFSFISLGQAGELPQALVKKMEKRLSEVSSGKLGVAFSDEEGLLFAHEADRPLVMQSVYKFPLALAILAQVDAGKWTLETPFKLTSKELLPKTWSPLREKYPEGGEFTLKELIAYTVAESDNNTCDFLFDLLGGPKKVESFLKEKGIENVFLTHKENDVYAQRDLQYKNVGTPLALNHLLKTFVEGKIVSPASTQFLLEVMLGTKTGAGRIKGKLPEGVKVAHKTGSGFDFKDGGSSALNDVGILYLPSGGKLYVSFLFQDSHESVPQREAVMADLSFWVYEALKGSPVPTPTEGLEKK